MEISKTVIKYGKIFRKILVIGNFPDSDVKQKAYEKRLTEMYASQKYAEHNIYPTTNAEHIYAVIAMCLELKEFGLSDKEIIDAVNRGFSRRRNFFKRLIKCIDCFLTAIRSRKIGIYQITISACGTAVSFTINLMYPMEK